MKKFNYSGMSFLELIMIAFVSVGATFLFAPIFKQYGTFWLCFGLWLTCFVFIHLCVLASRCLIMPEFICFVACINWLLAPALSYIYPPNFSLYAMSVSPEDYFSYVTPAVIALWIGIHTPLRLQSRGSDSTFENLKLSRHDRMIMDCFIIVGFFTQLIRSYLPGNQSGLGFLYYVIEELRFVGAFSYLFTRTKGWVLRISLIYILFFIQLSAGGVFYEFILWAGYLFISIAYIRRWRWRLTIYLVILIILVTVFNSAKVEYRSQLSSGQLKWHQRIEMLGNIYISQFKKRIERSDLGDDLVRWNQGWIISRVIYVVPREEPFALGKTIQDAIVAAIYPRIFKSDKVEIGSQSFFAQYTHLNLSSGTSMALSSVGEMYANFGRLGGTIAMYLYGFLIGFIFSRFARLAKKNIMWWAWAPFVMLTTLEAEWNVADVLNHVTKSLLVMLVLLFFIPAMRSSFFKRPAKLENEHS
ncbi:MAG: hypothetical protein AUJ72_06250 [Candidatus Omnitrophica bacterium CG1_02_46_14]|nr:MAG: hypothetical protein AUJ72_06250 [Candidatus Omnitrophica bacterium CG1_02_46_14]